MCSGEEDWWGYGVNTVGKEDYAGKGGIRIRWLCRLLSESVCMGTGKGKGRFKNETQHGQILNDGKYLNNS